MKIDKDGKARTCGGIRAPHEDRPVPIVDTSRLEEEYRQNLRARKPGDLAVVPEGLPYETVRDIAREEDYRRKTEMAWPLDAPPLEGRKDDGGKARHDLLAPEYLTGTAEILAFGAAKYGARNWEKGMAWSRPFAALMRHMWAWWAGEQIDAETGKSHLWHASCCLMFLVAYEQRKSGTDDRPNSA